VIETPTARYRALVSSGELKADPIQESAAQKLTALCEALARYVPRSAKKGWMARMGLGAKDDAPPPRGLYIYGGVGRGKSMLMNLFFDSAPVAKKERVHFHAFMRDIHAEIHRRRQLGMYEDEGDPIPGMADGIADTATLLCLDEMEIRDIADAMDACSKNSSSAVSSLSPRRTGIPMISTSTAFSAIASCPSSPSSRKNSRCMNSSQRRITASAVSPARRSIMRRSALPPTPPLTRHGRG
jgi:hypothetical protein